MFYTLIKHGFLTNQDASHNHKTPYMGVRQHAKLAGEPNAAPTSTKTKM